MESLAGGLYLKLREGMSSPRGKYKVQNAKAKDSTSSQSTEEASLKEKM